MSDVTKPILLDETGQSIVDALMTIAYSNSITFGTDSLTEDVSTLETGKLYVQIGE